MADDPDMEVGPTCTAEELAAQRYEAAKAKGDVLELSSDDEDEPHAKPQTPVKQPRRSRLDDVTFGANGRARDTHTQRKRRQIVISDDEESEEEDEVVFVTPPRKKRRSTPAPGVTCALTVPSSMTAVARLTRTNRPMAKIAPRRCPNALALLRAPASA